MQDELIRLHQQGLAAIGRPVTIVDLDGGTVDTRGVLKRQLVPTGQFSEVMQNMTVIALASGETVGRGYRIDCEGESWTVDRKIKDDGYLAHWSLYEYQP